MQRNNRGVSWTYLSAPMITSPTNIRVVKSDALRLDRLSRTLNQCVIGNGKFHSTLNNDPAPTVGMPSNKRRKKRYKSEGGFSGSRNRGGPRRFELEVKERGLKSSSQPMSVRPHTAERITSRNVSQGDTKNQEEEGVEGPEMR